MTPYPPHPPSSASVRGCQHPVCCMQQATYGFLYTDYGPTAWWWEVEELVRKLLLSALVVLIDAGSPLQVRSCSVLMEAPAP